MAKKAGEKNQAAGISNIEQSQVNDLEKRKATIEAAMNSIEKSLGVRVFQLNDQTFDKVQVIPTGVLSIDRALRVFGFPRGRIIELYGEPGSGKTMLSLLAAGQVQRNGGVAALIDMECAYDKNFGALLGVNNDALLYSQPECAEQAIDVIEKLVQTNSIDLIIVDSVANMVPKAELEGTMADNQIGLLARIMSKGLRKLTNAAARTKTTVIFINQIRMKIGVMFGNPETTTGGKALGFYATMRIEVRPHDKGGKVIEGEKVIGHRARVGVKKNKVGPPFGEGEITVYYGKGVDIVRDVCSVAKEEGILEGTSWISYTSDNFKNAEGNNLFKMQGFDNFVEAMRTRLDVIEEIRAKVIQKIEAENAQFQKSRDIVAEEQQEAQEFGEANQEV